MSAQEERCTYEYSGFCTAHQSEIDKREAMERIISKLWDDILPSMMTKMNWSLGVLTLIAIFVLGSYTYTYLTDQNRREDAIEIVRHADNADDRLRQRISDLTQTVNTLAESTSYQQAANKSYLREFSRLNNSLEKMLSKQERFETNMDKKMAEWWAKVREHEGGNG